MLEQQRIEYLQAMGIQLWMPRHALDNAAESNWLAGSETSNVSLEANASVPVKAGHAADLLAGMGLTDSTSEKQVAAEAAVTISNSAREQPEPRVSVSKHTVESQSSSRDAESTSGIVAEHLISDLTVPSFELHFALWPCGILWVSGQAFAPQDHGFQTAVSYSLLGSAAPQASYSQFKWPYIEGSDEDQSMPVALRALTAQWEFMSSQGARGWVAMDSSSQHWLEKVASIALFSVNDRNELYSVAGKKRLWHALQTLSKKSIS